MRIHSALISKIAGTALAIGIAQGNVAMADPLPLSSPVETTMSEQAKATHSPTVSIQPGSQSGKVTAAWSVAVNPRVPVSLIAGLGAVYALGCLLAMRRRLNGAWLRAVAGAAVVTALVNPELVRENVEKLATEVAVIVDRSPSQSIDGRDKMTTAASLELSRRLSQIPGVEVRTVETGNEPGADGTNLFSALDTVLGDVSPDRVGGVFILSDGQVHDAPSSPPPSIGKAPIHVLLSGHEGEHDRRLVIDSAPAYGLVNHDVTVEFHIIDDGVPAGQAGPVNVIVSMDGKKLRTESVFPGQPVKMTFPVPHGGANVIGLDAEKLAGELTTVNNRAAVSVNGIYDRMCVLLISGQPNESERLWRNLLKSDPATDLIHFTALRGSGYTDTTPDDELSLIPFPINELFQEKLDQFDLIIFDHYSYNVAIPRAYLQNVVDYVNKGGSLLVAAGPGYEGQRNLYQSPLRTILPAAPTGQMTVEPYSLHITGQGAKHPVTRNLGGVGSEPHWGRWLSIIDAEKTLGETLMTGADSKPLLVLNRQGNGRVGMLLSDDAWLWARGYENGGPYAELMQHLAHWLIKEPAMEEEALRMSARNGIVAVERQTMADKADPVTIHTPSGKTETLPMAQTEPGFWRATAPADEVGLYSADEGDKHAFINVGTANPKEWLDTISTLKILQPVVDRTDGSIQRIESNPVAEPKVPDIRERDAGQTMHGNGWAGIRMSDAGISKGYDEWPIFSGWFGFSALVGSLAAAWYKEGGGKFTRRSNTPGSFPSDGPKI